MQQVLRTAIFSLTIFCSLLTGAARAQQNALNFDGSNDYAYLPAGGFTAYTFECWVKFTGSTTASQTVIVYSSAAGPTTDCSHIIYTDASGHFKHFTWDNADHFVTGTTVAALNTWYHVAITAANNGYIHLYVNGVEEGTPTTVGTLWIGDRLFVGIISGFAGYLKGTVDEVRIWNRQLCASEISANMNGELLNPGTQSGLHRYYKFNQGTASGTNTGITSVTDASANAANGLLNNLGLTGSTSNWVAGTPSITGTLSASNNAWDEVALSNSTTTVNISGSTVASNCTLITKMTPSGAAPLSGSVTTKVTLDGSAQTYNGQAYVPRHYDIEPATNPNTATATITLYFTQADFDAYNLVRGTLPSLPTSTSDAANAANLRISQFHGIPSGGNAPANYPTTWGGTGPVHVLITPTSATYNSTYDRWDVVFPVTGFSGFFASSGSTPLPVKLTDFDAELQNVSDVLIHWNAASTESGNVFEVERSAEGQSFSAIGRLEAAKPGAYSLHDYSPLSGKNYYRVRTTDAAGASSFSNVQMVLVDAPDNIRVSPNPAGAYLQIQSDVAAGDATLTDILGGAVLQVAIQQGITSVDVHQLPAGCYLLRMKGGRTLRVVKN